MIFNYSSNLVLKYLKNVVFERNTPLARVRCIVQRATKSTNNYYSKIFKKTQLLFIYLKLKKSTSLWTESVALKKSMVPFRLKNESYKFFFNKQSNFIKIRLKLNIFCVFLKYILFWVRPQNKKKCQTF